MTHSALKTPSRGIHIPTADMFFAMSFAKLAADGLISEEVLADGVAAIFCRFARAATDSSTPKLEQRCLRSNVMTCIAPDAKPFRTTTPTVDLFFRQELANYNQRVSWKRARQRFDGLAQDCFTTSFFLSRGIDVRTPNIDVIPSFLRQEIARDSNEDDSAPSNDNDDTDGAIANGELHMNAAIHDQRYLLYTSEAYLVDEMLQSNARSRFVAEWDDGRGLAPDVGAGEV